MKWIIRLILFGLLICMAVIFINNKSELKNMKMESTAFLPNSMIPSKYTCEGDNTLNPPLKIDGVPNNAISLALIMDDPDVPKALRPNGVFDHWTVYNIPPNTTEIGEGSQVGVTGLNGAGKNSYIGPCPPANYEPSTHRYVFKLYALDTKLNLTASSTKDEVLKAMDGHILETVELVGVYKKQNQ